MKNIGLFLLAGLFLISSGLNNDHKPAEKPAEGLVNWVSLEEAQKLAKKNPKKILIDVYTTWCGPCKMMTKNTFNNPQVANYINENYYAVKFDAESPSPVVFNGKTYKNPNYDPNRRGRNGVHEFSREMRVSAYPTILYLDHNLNKLYTDKGYKTPSQIEFVLKFFEQHNKTEVLQADVDAYRAKFVPTFSDSAPINK